ncbi:DNA replication/repair protein RecF [Parasphingorhabdus litoris]|uniref:DNA replication and repair protein RecF n=1 Tax=Parasphingorhabdus litoris TaxID=394733 RepID=A0ABP3K8N7_9SPHN|nr:DNA replication/repair protein RecF [Parasphingorhabdus litoris]
MTISRLTLQNFRNYPQLRLETAPGFVVLSGDNGAGKTNILEAVSLLSPGRGLRRAPIKDMASEGSSGDFAVAAELGDIQLGTGTSMEYPERRKTRVNGAAVPTNDLAQWLSILWLTPAMDRLFMEGASGRRNFLDRLVTALEPEHARSCTRYDAARRERNRLLADEYMPDSEWLDALDGQLASFGSAVAEARFRITQALNDALAKTDDGLFAAAKLHLDDKQQRSEQELLQALGINRQADRRAGRTLNGPHRADLTVFHRAKDQAAEKCSTGEQKALLFSIILAHADLIADQRGSRPILLLDEVAAHLDPQRRAALFSKLKEKGGQVWLTGTEPGLFDDVPDDALHFKVAGGTVTKR